MAMITDAKVDSAYLDACMQGQNEKMAIMVGAIRRGIEDESIRADIGDPLMTSITLWGFMHGIIQISTTKAGVLSQYGLGGDALAQQALHLATRALAAGAAS